MNRSERIEIARQTIDIVERGYYELDGERIDIGDAIQECHTHTRLYTGEQLTTLRNALLASNREKSKTEIEVRNETTLAGLNRIVGEGEGSIAVLNFASAKNAGGGFFNGSQAQEESLARSSALYSSLLKAPQFYERHRKNPTLLYSDAMILSPNCPVFRNDEGDLLSKPQLATFITSAAPNAGATADNRPSELPQVPQVLHDRAELVLALAAHLEYDQLILGAWGCGVFRNDPKVVANAFAAHLLGNYAGCFRRVIFSVFDNSSAQTTYSAFNVAFASDALYGIS
ncbi:MAG: TIGR02452 family protein [Ignavibacteriae bacterium]|nr:TIGR02452 family protein [Ignavibacteriota bacterium]MCB9215895.1 TIGR02452 family protein [Ignavibacteria bacterium]